MNINSIVSDSEFLKIENEKKKKKKKKKINKKKKKKKKKRYEWYLKNFFFPCPSPLPISFNNIFKVKKP